MTVKLVRNQNDISSSLVTENLILERHRARDPRKSFGYKSMYNNTVHEHTHAHAHTHTHIHTYTRTHAHNGEGDAAHEFPSQIK